MRYVPFVTIFFLVACSPLYIMRAGWEESRILFKREQISDILDKDETSPALRHKLNLVLSARNYAKEIGLIPKKSFTTYTDIGRENLIWVLSACPKTSLTPVTWWFPIAGKVPYKGFFDKEDGIAAAEAYQNLGYDYNLRSSPAFSTLGWFNDPLLSTVTSFPTQHLIEVVLHELTHNTIWLKGSTDFNETLASFIGARATISFIEKDNIDRGLEELALAEWHDSLLYSNYLNAVFKDVKELLQNSAVNLEKEPSAKISLIAERDKLYERHYATWKTQEKDLLSDRYRKIPPIKNNALLIGQRIYYEQPEKFECLYQKVGRSLPHFIKEIKELTDRQPSVNQNIYEMINKRISELPLLCSFATQDKIYQTIRNGCPCTVDSNVTDLGAELLSSVSKSQLVGVEVDKLCNSCYKIVHKKALADPAGYSEPSKPK